MKYQASWVAQAVAGELIGADTTITGSVETDSRNCKAGSLYVARIGENTDGHQFIPAAISTGAVCSIISDRRAAVPGHTSILVADATLALGMLAKAHVDRLRSLGKIQVIGITGSVGKTTTKDLINGILSQFAPTVASEKSFNNEVGMPLTALRATAETRFLVLEMGASGPGHLTYLTDLVAPDHVVELTVGKAHLGGFGTVEALATAKAELVEGVRDGGVVILNFDDPQVLKMRNKVRGKMHTFSASGAKSADIRAIDVVLDEKSCPTFTVETSEAKAQVYLGLVGKHQVSNALAAISIALSVGMELDSVVSALNGMRAVSPHRMNVFHLPGITFIDDSYNANPDSMRAGLAVLAQLGTNANRRIAVLGEMKELGESSLQLHREVGECVEQSQVNMLITLGEDAKEIATSLTGKVQCYHVQTPVEAVELLKDQLTAGDVVFLKGSNGSGVWQIADAFAVEQADSPVSADK